MASTLLRTLIVDDEPVARRVLAEELAEIGGTEVVGEADNGEAAIRCIELPIWCCWISRCPSKTDSRLCAALPVHSPQSFS